MDSLSHSQVILKKMTAFHRINLTDADEKLKSAIENILHLWPDVLIAADTATDDELFSLNVSRALLTQVFGIVLSKDFVYKDHRLVRKIFFALFNILVNHRNIFRNNDSIFIDSNIRLIIKMASSVTSLVHFKEEDLSRPDDQQLLIAIREHIDQDSSHDNITDTVISLIWNLSDQTLLVPILLNTGYANSIVQWIRIREKKFQDDKIDAPIHILHNLARHDDGVTELNKYDALEVIGEVKFEANVADSTEDMTIHIAMIHALLMDIDQIKCNSTKFSNKIVNMLLQLAMDAANTDRCRHNGSHVSEPLTVLVKLFYNDTILQESLSNIGTKCLSIVETFAALLLKFYPRINLGNILLENYACVVILNLFWLISNHKQYRQVFRDHKELMTLIQNAANNEQTFVDIFMPRTMKSIQQAANDIVTNLNNEN